MEGSWPFNTGIKRTLVVYRIEDDPSPDNANCVFQIDHNTELVVVDLSEKLAIDHEHLDGYQMVGGLEKQIEAIRDLIEVPINHPDLFSEEGKRWHF